jgi:hypothetical protein
MASLAGQAGVLKALRNKSATEHGAGHMGEGTYVFTVGNGYV